MSDDVIPFRLAIDHDGKRLVIVVKGHGGHETKASMDFSGIAEFMAHLSHCQHVLAHSLRGHILSLPMEPATAFKPISGQFALGAHEGMPRFATGDDPTSGEIVLMLQGSSGRITGYRISQQTARALAQGLLDSVAKTSGPQTKQ